MTLNTDTWIGFSVFLPPGWNVPNKWESVAQIETTPDSSGSAILRPFTLSTGYGSWVVEFTGPSSSKRKITLNSVYEDVGRWVDFAIHYKPSTSSAGVMEVWKDGALVAKMNGANALNNKKGPFFMMGLKTGYSVSNKSLYLDELRVATGVYADLQDVAP
jgi:hypothetical protein